MKKTDDSFIEKERKSILKYNYDELNYQLQILEKLRDQGYKYICRAEHGEVRAFKKKPSKQINFWYVRGEVPCPIDSATLTVEWKDKTPLNILIKIKQIKKLLMNN